MSAFSSSHVAGSRRAAARTPSEWFQSLSEYGFVALLIILMVALVGLPMAFVVVSAFLRDPFDITSGFSLDAIISDRSHPCSSAGRQWSEQ